MSDEPLSPNVRRQRITFIVFWSAAVVAGLVAVRIILVPFVLALLLAYVLAPIVRRVSGARIGRWVVPRWVAVLSMYIVILATLTVVISRTAPAVASETRDFLRNEVPRLRDDLEHRWLPKIRSVTERLVAAPVTTDATDDASPTRDENTVHIVPSATGGYDVQLPADGLTVERRGNALRITSGRAEQRREDDELWPRLRTLGAGHTEDILRVGRGIVGGIVGGVFGFFITLMLSAYLLLTSDKIFAFFESLVAPAWRGSFQSLIRRIDRGLSGVVRGQLVICAVNGILSAIGFGFAHLPYWPLLALLAAIFSLVPIFGSILSSVPAVAIGLRSGLPTALFVLIWILGIHQLEANLLNPKIMGDSAKIHPVLVVFSLFVGEHFFGILGALLAVPAMSLVQSIFLHWRHIAMNYTPESSTSIPP